MNLGDKCPNGQPGAVTWRSLANEPVDFAAAINPVVAIVAAGQPFDVSILVTGQHGYNLPVALIDTVWFEVDFCFCHLFLMHEPQEQKKPRCDSALFVTQVTLGQDRAPRLMPLN